MGVRLSPQLHIHSECHTPGCLLWPHQVPGPLRSQAHPVDDVRNRRAEEDRAGVRALADRVDEGAF